jgi:outer membrane protein assembly factor BamB
MIKSEFKEYELRWRVAQSVMIISGLFSVVVCLMLIINCVQVMVVSPLDSPELEMLREVYADATEIDENLVTQIRALDMMGRKAHFTSQAQIQLGAILLLGGLVVFLLSLKLSTEWNPKVPDLKPADEVPSEWYIASMARQYMALGLVALVSFSLVAAYLTQSKIPQVVSAAKEEAVQNEDVEPPAETTVVAVKYPTWDDMLKQWPSFRGPGGNGVAHFTNAPTSWNVESGEGIRWKVELPKEGGNSPVVWGDQLYLSAADDDVREIYCYNTDSGELVWKKVLDNLPGTPEKPPRVSEDTGHAAATMVVHGDQVCAIYANGDLACYSSSGEFLWGRNLGVPDNHYGHSSSLIAFESRLFVQFDQRKQPRVFALDLATGKDLWSAERDSISWASPICIPTPFGPQLILNSSKSVTAYAPQTGAVLWQEACLGGEVAPSPAYSNNMVFVANEYAQATAIQLSAEGDTVKAEVKWDWDELLPEVSSPVGDKEHFYITTSVGDIVCVKAETGETLWAEMVDEGFYASPILVGERIYAPDLAGNVVIFKAGPEFERIAMPEMKEDVSATPVFLDGRIYLKTLKYLYCIENKT